MGYTSYEIRIPLRISSHNSDRDLEDWKAAEDLAGIIKSLIDSNPEFKRVALIGVEGP